MQNGFNFPERFMMPYSLLLPLLLYMDFGGNPVYNFKTENCFIVRSNCAFVRFNRVYHHNEFSDAEVEAIKTYFNKIPFSWIIDVNDQKAADILNNHGFVKYPDPFSGMVANISPIVDTAYGLGITVKEINQKEDIDMLIDIIARSNPGYEKSEWQKAIYDLLAKGTPHIKLYIGFYADQPCAASIIIYHKDMVTLHMISTLPEYRCKGLGCAVTHKALFDAACNGATTALLLASSMALSLYQKMGFKEHARYYIYLYK